MFNKIKEKINILLKRNSVDIKTIPQEVLFRFPGIIIEKYAYKKINKKLLERYNLYLLNFHLNKTQYLEVESNKEISKCKFYNDTNQALILNYENIAIAILGFEIKENIFFIEQIQGITFLDKENKIIKENFFINDFNWKKTLVEISIEYSLNLNKNLKNNKQIRQIIIQSAKNSKWFVAKANSSQGQRIYNIYDETAIELGFNLDEEENYVKNL